MAIPFNHNHPSNCMTAPFSELFECFTVSHPSTDFVFIVYFNLNFRQLSGSVMEVKCL